MGRLGKIAAFTLLELLLVLAVLATLSAMALPRVGRMLAKAEHRGAADGLQAALSQLRLRAIQTGQSHSFRFVSGSGVFELRAEVDDEVRQIDFDALTTPADQPLDDSLEQPAEDGSLDSRGSRARLADWAGADTQTQAVEDSGEASTEGDHLDRRQLAGGMVIVSQVALMAEEMAADGELAPATLVVNRDDSQENGPAGLPLDVSLGDDSAARQWSAPILFYPDGRASDARLFVVDPSGYAIELRVVGISGKVRVGARRRLPEGARMTDLAPTVPSDSVKEVEQ
jgi:prepilin-type N-terminal cleavage/methylation domain-containing protein